MRLSVAMRLWLLSGLSLILFLTAIFVGLWGIRAADDALKRVYEDRAVPLDQLSGIEGRLRANLTETLLALQHDPASRYAKLHDHPVSIHLEAIAQRQREAEQLWQQYLKTFLTEEEKRLIADFEKKRSAWLAKQEKVLAEIQKGEYSFDSSKAIVEANQVEFTAAMAALAKLREYQVKVAAEEYDAAVRQYHATLTFFGILALLGLGGLFFTAWLAQKRINRGIRQVSEVAQAIAAGHLDCPVPASPDDEIGALLRQVGKMRDALANIVRALRQNVESLQQAAHELAQTAAASQSSSEMQSESAASMAASVEELSVSIDHVKDSADAARAIAVASDAQSREGGQIIERAVEEVGGIAAAVNALAATIRELDALSTQISGIVGTIKEVADQTNLLALNAAIEAARAGEQGRGFAVVADEVRKLAERTGKSTEEIGDMIKKIQLGMKAATSAMTQGVKRVDEGVALARQAGQSVASIREGAAQATRAVEDINDALKEQSAAAREIAQRVERIAQGAEHNSATAAQTTASARRLESLAAEIDKLVMRFKLS